MILLKESETCLQVLTAGPRHFHITFKIPESHDVSVCRCMHMCSNMCIEVMSSSVTLHLIHRGMVCLLVEPKAYQQGQDKYQSCSKVPCLRFSGSGVTGLVTCTQHLFMYFWVASLCTSWLLDKYFIY